MTTSPVTTMTDELLAELDDLANCGPETMTIGAAMMATLLAERAELKKDAERYRYIVKWLSHYGAGSSRGVCMPSDYSSSTKEQCDESIDTAIKQQKEPAQ